MDEPFASDEHPTLVPSFDPAAFARDSETKQRSVVPDASTIDDARRLHDRGEHEEALFLLTDLLRLVPSHPEATLLMADCRAALERDCWNEIGASSAILLAAVSADELKGFALDNVSAFLISLLDGNTDVETVLDLCGLPRLLALRHLRGLVRRGIVAARER